MDDQVPTAPAADELTGEQKRANVVRNDSIAAYGQPRNGFFPEPFAGYRWSAVPMRCWENGSASPETR